MEPPMRTASPALSELPWQEWVSKATLTAAIAGVTTFAVMTPGKVPLFGMNVPVSIAAGLGCAAGSLTADFAHEYVLPYIPHNEKYMQAESAALGVFSAGVGNYIFSSLVGPAPRFPIAFGIGAGSYVLADYTWVRFLNGKTGGLF